MHTVYINFTPQCLFQGSDWGILLPKKNVYSILQYFKIKIKLNRVIKMNLIQF